MKCTDLFVVVLIVTKLTGFSFSRVASCTLIVCFFSLLHCLLMRAGHRETFFPVLSACAWVYMLVFAAFMLSFAYFLLMCVLCPFLVLGSKFHLHMLPYSASRSFCFSRDQCPFLSTCVIQPLYLFADRKQKTWLYYVNVLVKVFPLHGISYAACLVICCWQGKKCSVFYVSLVCYAVQPWCSVFRG